MTINIIYNGHGDNNTISNKAHPVGDLGKENEAEHCAEKDLGIIINRDFICWGVVIGGGNRKLASCGTSTGTTEH